jgi:hypothetical protein
MRHLDDSRRKNIAIIFLAVFVTFMITIFGSMLIFAPDRLSDTIALELGVLVLGSMILFIFAISDVPTELKVVWTTFQLILRPFESKKYPNIKTFFGVDNKTILGESMSKEARSLRDEINEIISDGKTTGNFERSLSLLIQNHNVIQDCWILLLNKARFLHLLGKTEESKEILDDVKTRFQDIPKAISCVYEIQSWQLESQLNYETTDLESLAKDSIFLEQRSLLEKGLDYNEENHAILMSLFVVAVIQKQSKIATNYFVKAISINQALAFETIEDIKKMSPNLIEQAKLLGLEITDNIEALTVINNRNKKRLGLLKNRWLISLLFISIISYSINLNKIAGSSFSEKEATNLTSLELYKGGTNLGSGTASLKAKDEGTNLGNQTLSVKKRSGGTNLGKNLAFLKIKQEGTNLGNQTASLKSAKDGTNLGNQTLSLKKRRDGTNLGNNLASLRIKRDGTNFGIT